MHGTVTQHLGSRPARTDDLDLLRSVPGLACSVRDEDMRLVWANPTYAREIFGADELPENCLGTDLTKIVSLAAAEERSALQRKVITTGKQMVCYQLHADRRSLATVIPLDADSFGFRGVLNIMNIAPGATPPPDGQDVCTLKTPAFLGKLALLTHRELEVIHLCGRGMSVPKIAKRLYRSTKTMENHIRSIHIKLGIRGRGELTRFCVERGLHAFTWEEWLDIIEHFDSPEPSKRAD